MAALRRGLIGLTIAGGAGFGYCILSSNKIPDNPNGVDSNSDINTEKVMPYHHANYTYPDKNKYTLKQVNIVFRHGARTPLAAPAYWHDTEYKKELLNHPPHTKVPHKLAAMDGNKPPDSLIEKSYAKRGLLQGGIGQGQLTGVGAEQMHSLGESLRRIYIDNLKFLNRRYDDKEVYVRTSNLNRTLESARCVNAGLFHVPDDEPISIYTAEANDEIIYPNYFACPMLKKLTKWAWDDPDKLPGLKKQREDVQTHMGISHDDHKVNLVEIRDCLAAEAVHGMTDKHPPESVMQKIEKGATAIMHSVFVGPEDDRSLSAKLSIGPLIEHIVNNLELKNSKKLYMFSGHDTTIIPLLSVLGVWNSEWPYYGSSVTFELWHSGEGEFVRMLYNGETQIVKGCSVEMCPLNEFKQAVKHARVSPAEYQRLCNEDEEDMTSRRDSAIPGIKA